MPCHAMPYLLPCHTATIPTRAQPRAKPPSPKPHPPSQTSLPRLHDIAARPKHQAQLHRWTAQPHRRAKRASLASQTRHALAEVLSSASPPPSKVRRKRNCSCGHARARSSTSSVGARAAWLESWQQRWNGARLKTLRRFGGPRAAGKGTGGAAKGGSAVARLGRRWWVGGRSGAAESAAIALWLLALRADLCGCCCRVFGGRLRCAFAVARLESHDHSGRAGWAWGWELGLVGERPFWVMAPANIGRRHDGTKRTRLLVQARIVAMSAPWPFIRSIPN